MFFWNKFCGGVIVFLFFCSPSFAQATLRFTNTTKNFSTPEIAAKPAIHFYLPALSSPIQRMTTPVAANFVSGNYSFFCREELKIEKATKIPLRVRVGSLEQCNYYEGKKQ